MKSIKNIVKEFVLKETHASFEIDDSNFFAVLIGGERTLKKFGHFLLFAVTLILCITFIISSFMFFINDVLLFQNNVQVNEAGAFIPHRSCNRETALYLFNAADYWAKTGIQLNKGDKITISYSGAFHSDVAMLKDAAETNKKPKYEWVTYSKPEDKGKNKFLVYNNKEDSYFGSILYAITGENGVSESDSSRVQQIERGKKITIKQNGTLYLAVNDIYLTDEVIKKYGKKNEEYIKRDTSCDARHCEGVARSNPVNCLFTLDCFTSFAMTKLKIKPCEVYNVKNTSTNDSIIKKEDFKNHKDSIDLYWMKVDRVTKNTTYLIYGQEFEDSLKINREGFYNDNLGEILVAIDIERKIDFFSWRSSWYRYTETLMNNAWDSDNIFSKVFGTLGCLLWSIFILLWLLKFIVILIVIMLYFPYFKKVFIRFKKKKNQKCMVQLYQKCMAQLYMITTYSIKIIRQKVPVFKKVYFIIRYSIHSLIILIIYLIYLLLDVIHPLIPYICYPFSQKYYSQLKNKKK
jgi:hypothetical protein